MDGGRQGLISRFIYLFSYLFFCCLACLLCKWFLILFTLDARSCVEYFHVACYWCIKLLLISNILDGHAFVVYTLTHFLNSLHGCENDWILSICFAHMNIIVWAGLNASHVSMYEFVFEYLLSTKCSLTFSFSWVSSDSARLSRFPLVVVNILIANFLIFV